MGTVEITKRMAETLPRSKTRSVKTRFVLAYYLLSILTGVVLFFIHGTIALVAAVCYLAATALFYGLSVSKRSAGALRKARDS